MTNEDTHQLAFDLFRLAHAAHEAGVSFATWRLFAEVAWDGHALIADGPELAKMACVSSGELEKQRAVLTDRDEWTDAAAHAWLCATE
jgi:hypothetical protein